MTSEEAGLCCGPISWNAACKVSETATSKSDCVVEGAGSTGSFAGSGIVSESSEETWFVAARVACRTSVSIDAESEPGPVAGSGAGDGAEDVPNGR